MDGYWGMCDVGGSCDSCEQIDVGGLGSGCVIFWQTFASCPFSETQGGGAPICHLVSPFECPSFPKVEACP